MDDGKAEHPLWPPGDGEMVRRIRAQDWGATPLGPVEGWPEPLRSAVDLVLPAGFPMIILWGPDLIQIYNGGYRDLMGRKHPAGLGQPTRECWPEVWHINGPIYDRVRAGETVTIEDGLYPLARNGAVEDAWFTLSYSPLRDAGHAVAGVLVTLFETTARHRAEDELRASEARYRAFVTASSDVVYRMSPDWSEIREVDGRGFDTATHGPAGEWFDTYVHPEDRPAVRAAIEEAIRTKAPFELERRVRHMDGSFRWLLSRAVPVLDERGAILEWLGTAKDSTARREAEARLRESEERFRLAMQAIDGMVFDWNVPSGHVERSDGLRRLLGYDPAQVEPTTAWWAAQMHPDDLGRRVTPAGRALLKDGGRFTVEVRMRHRDGHWVDIQDTGIIRHDAEGRPLRVVGSSVDVTARNRAEAALRGSEKRLQVLVAELQHRTRNLLAVVRNIVRRSFGASPEREALDARLAALGRVQGFLSRSETWSVSLAELVEVELKAVGAASGRVTVSGPPVRLPGDKAEPVALAVHELATNAAKYGALLQENARLSVRWHVEDPGSTEGRLVLEWRESAVRMPPGAPLRRGFGSELIERALPYQLKARTQREFTPDGVHCTITLPLDPARMLEAAG